MACWIFILIKMFKTESGPLQGIIGILCGLWAFIWGWMNAGKLGVQKIMLIWTVAILVSIVGNVLTAGSVARQHSNAFPVQSR